jgi:CheY-like chemotaxis protein
MLMLVPDSALDFRGISEISVSAETSAALAREHYRPNTALMDIQLPVLDTIKAIRRIVAGERPASVRLGDEWRLAARKLCRASVVVGGLEVIGHD